jgi:RNA polymerase sigma factor (sigma-70 family)
VRYQLELRNGIGTDALRTLIDESVAHLDRRAAGLRSDALFLRIVVGRNDVRSLYRVSLKLDIPRRVLVVDEEQHDRDLAVRSAFSELARRLIRARQKTRPQDSRHAVRAPAGARAQAEVSREAGRRRQAGLDAFEQQRQALQVFVRRELSYHASVGALPENGLSVADVMADVANRATTGTPKAHTKRDARAWLTELALEAIDAGLMRRRDTARPLPTTEEILERDDLQDSITRTLAALPRAWRRVFVLHAVDGLALREIARILGRSRAAVDADLNHARQFLRQRLVDAGFVADEDAAQSFFASLPEHRSSAAALSSAAGDDDRLKQMR